MTITHQISDFLFDLFPKAKDFANSIDVLQQEVRDYYTFSVFQPIVTVNRNTITVEINNAKINEEKPLFDKVVSLCEKGEYPKAKPILSDLIQRNPSVSEYHRIQGQILSIEGNNEDAINSLIDALKWNPQNHSALVMMGNIYYRNFRDEKTAKKYFDEALAQRPDDITALNNYGTLYLLNQKYTEAKQYFDRAYEIDKNNPFAAYGIAYCLNEINETSSAFEYAIHGIKSCKKLDKDIFTELFNLTKKISEKVIESNVGAFLVADYKTKLEVESGQEIRIELDNTISTFAKIEIAESYKRDYHILKHKDKKGVEHLIMHELTHLLFAIQARKENQQMLFISNSQNKVAFLSDLNKHKSIITKQGIPEESIRKYYDSIFSGINLQIFNAPIDLFIEDYLYKTYPDLKPIQFISLLNMLEYGKEAVSNKESIKISPPHIFQASKILNLVHAFHFANLFGISYVSDFNPNKFEQNLAQKFYDEYLEYRDDRQFGEEYELVQHWGEDLKLDAYFELLNETKYHERNNPASLLKNIEEDPYGELDPDKEKKLNEFLENQSSDDINIPVVAYMVDAIKFFKPLSDMEIKKVAMEIALLGSHGISPNSDQKYKVAAIPNSSFTGTQLLAYFYVSFKLALPEVLPELKLPYDKEYEMASKWEFKK
jgi:tetratricopeptide (TPR) repeat protein